MSREILFRGKRPNCGEWIEGFLYQDDDVSLLLSPRFKFSECIFKVIPETVGQFIGYYDSTKWGDATIKQQQYAYEKATLNGTNPEDEWKGIRIFEGDIISFLDAIDTSTESGYDFEDILSVGKIEWYQDDLRWNLTNRESIDMDVVNFATSKVLGNIHDNPNLLNETNQR